MNRIDQIFADRRAAGSGALMPFVTAGYPSLEATAAILPALQEAGASICEIGFPFSDPIADGPVVQASMTAALDAGVDLDDVFDTVAAARPNLDLGLVAMVSFSIVYRVGVEAFIERAKTAGFDGFIFPDLPLEESADALAAAADAGMTASLLIAPTTPDARAAQIASVCTGFIYMLARTGITGERDTLPDDLAARIERIKQATDLPIAVGFGISKADHVKAVTSAADAAIVGSALVRRIGEQPDATAADAAQTAGAFVGELATGLA